MPPAGGWLPSTHRPPASTPRRDRWDSTDQRDSEDRTDPADSHEPTDRIDSADPTLPIEANDPTLPMDSIDPREPIDSTLSWDHSDQREFELPISGAWQQPAGVSMRVRSVSMTDNAESVAHGHHHGVSVRGPGDARYRGFPYRTAGSSRRSGRNRACSARHSET